MFLVWSFWPVTHDMIELSLSNISIASENGQDSYVIRKLTLWLEYPGQARVGDTAKFRLTILPFSVVDENGWRNTRILFESRIDLPDESAGLQPSQIKPAIPGHKVEFQWDLNPKRIDVYRGMVWLYLNSVNRDNGLISRQALLARPIEMEGVGVLGFPVNYMCWVGITGIGIGLLLCFLGNMLK